jgi:hypothetical protein
MNYAPFNDYTEMMKRKIWINRAFGVDYGLEHFLIWAAWRFGTRCIYWLSRQPFEHLFTDVLFFSLLSIFDFGNSFLGSGMAKETNNL